MKESQAQKAFNILKKHLTYGDFKELESIISIYCDVAYQKSMIEDLKED